MTEENRALGTPLGKHPTRVLFLGSGELGKEVTIELMRLGAWVCAADSYAGAPAQQVAHEYRVLDMANADQLRALFDEIQPDIIVPEVEAIATSELAAAAARGAQVVPSAEIAAICMDRERLRVLAHEELGLPTTPYRFAGSLEELREGAQIVGYPCVVKPIMSSSGHGQSIVRTPDAIDAVLNYEVHDYLFFCARATFDGYHNFARTLREHNANARAYSAELNRRKIK